MSLEKNCEEKRLRAWFGGANHLVLIVCVSMSKMKWASWKEKKVKHSRHIYLIFCFSVQKLGHKDEG